ncbi:hypothetical protein, unknown function [Leishmania braziliensis MHOM/BR/75/M2904]|uniref:Uncharacterized protein n=2 Tax=Leishmania braziliensis TaxID=5660 RepID=A4HDM0_LEIBR|nr:hypothetical protein, unknown function [Leishmania braziliensis MHOM/BR/75/M2904]CAJ2473773.1 unnamed protein product [Leishmania braziliensis]CAJ2474287.1 unnamed protein product [Leishmania braziliensis]CAM42341.1 hypothetical protein, unknown function [Leishmania braziliensis MHOM/BR/75/M2904]SYZ66332.1 hypothetical_protein [Leishmania braziliensis MHOM/BR/75/M2904]
MSRSQEINDSAAEAMRRADNADAPEYWTEVPHPESCTTAQQQQLLNDAAAEAMRRADVAYTKDDEL